MARSKQKRYRSFAFVQLIDNLPENWKEQFRDMLCESCFIVHDKDEAKEHVHFFIYFQGKRSINGVLDMIPDDFKVLHVEPVRSKLAYIRYMLHWGYPEKHRYNYEDLEVLGGLKINVSDLADVDLVTVIDCLQDHNFTSLFEFLLFCKDKRPELLRFTQTHFQLIEKLISASS